MQKAAGDEPDIFTLYENGINLKHVALEKGLAVKTFVAYPKGGDDYGPNGHSGIEYAICY